MTEPFIAQSPADIMSFQGRVCVKCAFARRVTISKNPADMKNLMGCYKGLLRLVTGPDTPWHKDENWVLTCDGFEEKGD